MKLRRKAKGSGLRKEKKEEGKRNRIGRRGEIDLDQIEEEGAIARPRACARTRMMCSQRMIWSRDGSGYICRSHP